MKNARPEVIVCSCSRYAALASRVSALAPLLLGSLGCDGADRMELTARSSALDAGSVVDAGSDGAATDAGTPVREVFRPEEVPPTPELVAGLVAPRGFEITTFADGLEHARMLAARGDAVYLTRPRQGDVLRLRDVDGDGVADERITAISGLELVHGIAFGDGDDVYLATPTEVHRATVAADGRFTSSNVIISDLPDGGQHPYRTLGIGPDGALYISVGSSCDACEESNPEHATMLRASRDGATREVLARGLRNTIGFAWHPTTGELWGMDHGSDWRGNDTPPEELNRITAGADYGWPYCYGQRHIDPVIADPPEGTKAERCASTTPPVLETQAHNAPIGFVFYDDGAFPSEYRGSAFVAMRGSWNRLPPTGYKVVRVRFDTGGVPSGFEDFVTGFLIRGGEATFARPAGIAVADDGAILLTDDSNGVIYRVAYTAGGADAGVGSGDASAGD